MSSRLYLFCHWAARCVVLYPSVSAFFAEVWLCNHRRIAVFEPLPALADGFYSRNSRANTSHIYAGGVILRHGERYGYLLGLLEGLTQEWLREGVKIGPDCRVFYDVACRFEAYAKEHGDEKLMEFFKFATGKLHGATHSLACQLEHNGLHAENAGDNPGEQCEICFARTHRGYALAKYMTPANYLRFYVRQYLRWNESQAHALPDLLAKMGTRAAEGQAAAEKALPGLYEQLYGPVTAEGDSEVCVHVCVCVCVCVWARACGEVSLLCAR